MQEKKTHKKPQQSPKGRIASLDRFWGGAKKEVQDRETYPCKRTNKGEKSAREKSFLSKKDFHWRLGVIQTVVLRKEED